MKALSRILLSDAFQPSDIPPPTRGRPREPTALADERRRHRRGLSRLTAAAGTLDSPAVARAVITTNVRRTVYGKINSRFDLSHPPVSFPDANITSDRRTETTVPQQMLFAMGPFAVHRRSALAKRSRPSDPQTASAAYWL